MSGTLSLSAALTVPKVTQGNAPNVYTQRFQDSRISIYPRSNLQDGYGRQVHHDSIVTLTGGPSHPNARIFVENAQRPSYSVYLNAGGIDGDYENQVPSYGRYDTMLGKVPGRDQGEMNLNGQYTVPMASPSAGQAVYEASLLNYQQKAMQQAYQTQRFSH